MPCSSRSGRKVLFATSFGDPISPRASLSTRDGMATNSHAAFEQPNEHGHLCEQFVERDDLGPPLSTAEILEGVLPRCRIKLLGISNHDETTRISEQKLPLGLSIEFRIAMQELVLVPPNLTNSAAHFSADREHVGWAVC